MFRPGDIDITNVVFERYENRSSHMTRGAYQVLMPVAPFLQAENRLHLEQLAQEYLARKEGG